MRTQLNSPPIHVHIKNAKPVHVHVESQRTPARTPQVSDSVIVMLYFLTHGDVAAGYVYPPVCLSVSNISSNIIWMKLFGTIPMEPRSKVKVTKRN